MSIVRRQTQTMVKRTWLLSGRTRRLGRRCSCRGRRHDTVTQLGAVQPSARCERRGDRVLSPIEHTADCLLPQRLRPSRRRSRHRAASPPGAHPPCTCPSACGRRGPYRRLITIPRRLDGRRSRSRRRVLRSPFLFKRAGGGRRCTLSDRGPRRRRRGERWTRRRVDAPKLLGRGCPACKLRTRANSRRLSLTGSAPCKASSSIQVCHPHPAVCPPRRPHLALPRALVVPR
jgi:hypothetical protein